MVTKGLLDRNGNMWFTTLKEGVFRYDGISFQQFTVSEGLCSNKVNSVFEDNQGHLWFATAKGLCLYDGQSFANYPLPKEHASAVSHYTGLASRFTEEILC